jgi:hypothetical protein
MVSIDNDAKGCIALIVVFTLIVFVMGSLMKMGIDDTNIFEECQKTSIKTARNLDLCFFKYTYDSKNLLDGFKIEEFTINKSPYYYESDKIPYTYKSCTFTNIVFEINPLENVQFIDCTFINTKFNDMLIQNALFVNCIFEGSEFNNCIFGKNVKYYDWTVSTITLNQNTYTPEHIENGVNKFETFVENSKE